MIDEDKLLDEIRRLADEGTPPTGGEMDSDGAFCRSTYHNRFGSWNEAVRSAGYDPNDNISETELLNEIRRLAKEGTPPTCEKMNSDGKFSASSYCHQFGSWNDAIQAAGFAPNEHHSISETELLNEIRRLANEGTPPTKAEMNSDGAVNAFTYHRRFGGWWTAVVRAGLTPHRRRPLTDRQFSKMVDTAQSQQIPLWRLVALLHLFTGLPPTHLNTVTADRVTSHASGTLVTIPGTDTQSGDNWQFKLPTTWGDGQETELPGLLTWYLDRNERVAVGRQISNRIIHRVARDAGIERQTIDTRFGPAPDVTPGDLRATGGVRMAQNNAPARRIRRHLGIKHTNWDADVDDFFLWLYVHEGYEHPDYEPTGTYLEPI